MRLRRLWSLHRDQKGQILAEFALVLPILIVVLAGVLVFGMLVNAKQSVAGAAREAARKYSLTGEVEAARTVATDYLRGNFPAFASEIDCQNSSTSKCQMQIVEFQDGENIYVRVTVRYMQDTYLGRILLMPSQVPIYGTAVFRMAPYPG